jgi:cytochrome c peroxidase
VPSLRNVAKTAPYMHNGSLPTLEAVVRHYSQVDIERLHGDDGTRLVRPLQLSPREIADLVAFLETLSSPVAAAK